MRQQSVIIAGWKFGVTMRENLLLFDVGNTTTKVGLRAGEEMRQFAFRTDSHLTPDDIGLKLLFLLDRAGLPADSVEAAVISSVVPGADPELAAAIDRYVGCPVFFVPRDIPVPLENRYRNPSEVGADRLVVSCAARMLFPDAPSLIVIDSGTALTFDCVSGNAYLGGLIFPGPATALDALAGAAAKLPRISLQTDAAAPEPCIDTATSIRHGIVFGFASLVDGLTARLSAGLPGPVRVIGTGGFLQMIAGRVDALDDILPALLLDGLAMLYRQYRIANN